MEALVCNIMSLGADVIAAFLLAIGVSQWMKPFMTDKMQPQMAIKAFDFIVVGAGPAGSAVASRLSENANHSILLLEAGGESNAYTDIPYIGYSFGATPMSYRYKVASTHENSWIFKNNQSMFFTGKATGGSSMHNGMICNRGDPKSFDKWCKEFGAKGWCYKDVLPLFKKMESYANPKADLKYRGKDGPIRVEDLPYKTPLAETYLRATASLGIPLGDYNGPRRLVAGFNQVTANKGPRVTASNAYLRGKKRPNLHILRFAKVTKVLFRKGSNGELKAIGVRFKHKLRTHTIYAKKELILSAGAIETPKLLMLSGVGPEKSLKKAGIPVVKDLPVGQNLIDHVLVRLVFNLNKNGESARNISRDLTMENWKRYINGEPGPLSLPGGEQAVLYFKSSVSKDEADLQMDLVNHNTVNFGHKVAWVSIMNGKPELWDRVFARYSYKNTISLFVSFNAPRCRGEMHLNPKKPSGAPIFAPRYLCHPDDEKAVAEGIKLAKKLMEFPEFQRYGLEPLPFVFPGCESLSEDSALLCYARATVLGTVHYHGTCRIGPPGVSVVDAKLRVHGVKGLRIADASTAPGPYTGNTQMLSYLMGEMASEFIKVAWKSK